ncbi:hypothetical protein [Synechococcus sp. CBW1004]|jgi:hypothetical protein|uniref:hypothetical protein n=1 Tax=Synechococcus sp. CBW1004 TaxID=1353136 RepID=UPI0018CE20FD|nr:hypothetical protein [Synechococcus sp. CBW1004]QPN64514.1 hypothetical protein H8F25_07175 [Synechococcus sp. CBW1004]
MLAHHSLLLLAALLPLQAVAQPLGLVECRHLRERRNQLAAEAMQAEIALVQATRMDICPQQERLAERANAQVQASTADQPSALAHPVAKVDPVVKADPVAQAVPSAQPESVDFDYTAYLECRRQAEERLQRSRTILYTNQRGFTFYTVNGARFAREADGLQLRLSASCDREGGS